jgi:hypothetical protein
MNIKKSATGWMHFLYNVRHMRFGARTIGSSEFENEKSQIKKHQNHHGIKELEKKLIKQEIICLKYSYIR